jgi:hypothetical protein
MRAATIAATVLVSALMGSTPVSSLSTLREAPHSHACAPATQPSRAISLVGSQGAFGIVVFTPDICIQ